MRVVFASVFRSSCLCVAGGLMAFSLASCAGDKPPSLSEQIAAEGEAHANFAQEVASAERAKNDAEKAVKTARKAIKRAQKDLDEAHQDLEDAQQRLTESQAKLAEVEAEAQSRGFSVPPRP